MKKIDIKKKSFLKKLLIKLNRKLGFEIIDQNSLMVPTSNKTLSENLSVFNEKNITLPLGEVNINR